jgi:GAF domain-containing protein
MVHANPPTTRSLQEVHAALDAAVRGIAGLASVDDALQVIVDRVRPLVGAEYAALGIVDADGRIERFITSGMDDQTRRRIGALPEGHGLLGLIIRENRSFRISDLNIDARRFGFPPSHPPMTSFLGVPITIKGASLGRLYLTNRIGADEFSDEDRSLVETFALHAGIAMENARLHEQLQRLAVVDERERISKDLHDGSSRTCMASGCRSRTCRSSWSKISPRPRHESSGRSTQSTSRSRTFATSSSACGRSCWRGYRWSLGWLH